MMSAIDAAGPQAGAIAWLWWLFLGVTTMATIATLAFFVYAILRPRSSADRNGADSHDAARETQMTRTMSRAVSTGAALTVILLAVLLVANIAVGRQLTTLSKPGAITIQVVARQWWWDVRYQHPTPSQRVNTVNEIHIPVGEPVHIVLASSDVIHSFWVPNLHGKKDAIPAHDSDVWLQADRPGVFRGQCAEFCGLQHANMAFHVIAEPRDKFQAWIDQQRRTPPVPEDPLARRGRDVFVSSDCALCHRVQGTTAGATFGPDLTHVGGRAALAGAVLPNDPVTMKHWIRDPQRFKPGTNMPAHPNITDDDLNALVDYLGTLK